MSLVLIAISTNKVWRNITSTLTSGIHWSGRQPFFIETVSGVWNRISFWLRPCSLESTYFEIADGCGVCQASLTERTGPLLLVCVTATLGWTYKLNQIFKPLWNIILTDGMWGEFCGPSEFSGVRPDNWSANSLKFYCHRVTTQLQLIKKNINKYKFSGN